MNGSELIEGSSMYIDASYVPNAMDREIKVENGNVSAYGRLWKLKSPCGSKVF